jgi:predicted DNA-binding WGR domain protein
MACYLECSEGGAPKFWKCQILGASTTVSFGKLGTSGTAQTKDHGSEEKAAQFFAKIKSEKVRKGYKEAVKVDSTSSTNIDSQEPKTFQIKKRPAAIIEGTQTKQKLLKKELTQRTSKSGAPCFKGCVFDRTGTFQYQKALKDLVEKYGGEFTKNPTKATHVLYAGTGFFAGAGGVAVQKVLQNGGVVVPLPSNFPQGRATEEMAEYLTHKMQIAEKIIKQEFIAGKHIADICSLRQVGKTLAQEFLQDAWFPGSRIVSESTMSYGQLVQKAVEDYAGVLDVAMQAVI